MSDSEVNTYDEILYPGLAFPQTHPDRLATLAKLFGMTPAPVERARVLELGCGDGSNLLPMALALPESEFVGIDLAARPISTGQEMIRALGLQNIALTRMDVLDVADDFGHFDYIIAHGLYSWVPPVVREKVLALCRAHLAPQGVAFVSYNAQPGGHLREMLREMMLFHVRNLEEPQQRISQAKSFLNFLLNSREDEEDDAYRMLLKKEVKRVVEHSESHLFHDDLAEINSFFYFYEFVEQAARHDLQYLAEADYFEMQDASLPPRAAETLRQLGDNPVVKEQYADFVKCRRFRQTLLCHGEVSLERAQKPEQLRSLYVSSPARPGSIEPDIKSSAAVVKFEGAKGASVETDNPLTKAALLHLGALWPRALHFDELLAGARSRLGREARVGEDSRAVEDSDVLGEVLLRLYAANLVELRTHAPRFATEAGERPVASPLARLQVARSPVVTSLLHTSVNVEDALGRQLLFLSDGTRDRGALLQDLLARMETGSAATGLEDAEGAPGAGARRIEEVLAEQVEENLASFARHALLMS